MADDTRPRVLVIDDDEIVRRAVGMMLEKRAQVTAVETAEAAREQLRAAPFDAIICDYDLGPSDGVALLEEAEALQPNARRILFSARRPVGLTQRLIDRRIHIYLQKPAMLEDLVGSVSGPLPPPPERPSAPPLGAAPLPSSGPQPMLAPMDPAIVMDDTPPVLAIRMRRTPNDAEFEEMLRFVDELLSRRVVHVTVMDVSASTMLSARLRKRQTEWLRAQHGALKDLCAAMAFVSSALIPRLTTQVISTLVPPPMPLKVFSNDEEAREWLAPFIEKLEAER